MASSLLRGNGYQEYRWNSGTPYEITSASLLRLGVNRRRISVGGCKQTSQLAYSAGTFPGRF